MDVFVKEKNLDEVKKKIDSIISEFGKISYMESALNANFTFDVKRYLYTKLAELCEFKKMYDKAAKALVNRTTIEVTFRERIATFTKAGELYAKAGSVEESIQTFLKAMSEANTAEKQAIRAKVRQVFLECAKEAEKGQKKSNAIRYYEKLLELPLGENEKKEIKEKLAAIYKSLGKFAEMKSLEMGLRGGEKRAIPTQVERYSEKTLDERTRPSKDDDLGIDMI